MTEERYASKIGATFGFMTLVRVSETRGDGNRVYGIFRCECGQQIDVAIGRVIGGTRQHCGCKANRTPGLKHGKRESVEYSSWISMKRRCLDPGHKDYPRYGGAGVTVHPKWVSSFEDFYEHIGARPKGTTLDRKDTLRGYEPGNVRWATPSEQLRNRRISKLWHIKGTTFDTLADAAAHHGVHFATVSDWVRGKFDRRRNKFIPPRSDCYATRKY